MGYAKSAVVYGISSGVSTWGDTGDPVKELYGVTEASLKAITKVERVNEGGRIGPGRIAARTAESGEGSLTVNCLYEQMPTYLNGFFAALDQSSSAVTPYNFPYTAPVTSTQAYAHYTMVYGTSGMCYRANGTLFTDLTIKGEAGGLWEMTVGTLAKEIVPSTTGYGTLAGPSSSIYNPIRMADTVLYIDDFDTGTIGGTTAAGMLISFELGIKTGKHLKPLAGSLTPASFGDGKFEVTLKLQLEMTSTAKALIDEGLGSTGAMVTRQIRVGAYNSASRQCNLDFAGVLMERPTFFEDREGNIIGNYSFEGLYSTALTNAFACNVVTSGTTSST